MDADDADGGGGGIQGKTAIERVSILATDMTVTGSYLPHDFKVHF